VFHGYRLQEKAKEHFAPHWAGAEFGALLGSANEMQQ
jgi:hypothetical protein